MAARKPAGKTTKKAPAKKPAAPARPRNRKPRQAPSFAEIPSAPSAPVVDEVVAPIAATLDETPTGALERALAVVTSTPRRAVQIATVRALAKALENADPGDVPKISRELDARMAALMADAIPVGEPPDWTEQAGGTAT